ncbi:S1 family peptidase [Amorphoplanes digitatis]|uniref:Streptogrisin C n=1 Tax=Actinoplanes digitatis TaxID=1868 RepID=A0A7W7MMY6_9ACTN|nr:S1 family peptidase [Actinoplanes digitatis]MBB4760446.1 streptogrisin C [Actinoplanes digitatis]GID95403.1 serine protease [Actinoplanes digitatis]
MQRRTVVAIAATVTAAGAAVAFTLPSMAGTNTPRRSTPQATGAVAPQLLAAMKRDLGVSTDEAAARVRRAAWASGVAAQLRAAAGDSYAGSWLGGDGTTLNIGVTDPGLVAQVRAAGAVPRLVERSVAELDRAKQALDSEASRSDRDLPGWYVDVAANKVVVQALPGDTDHARELAEDAGISRAAVKVVVTKRAPRILADVIGAEPYFVNIGGGQARCSIGFAVEGGFVTAGHCGAEGTQTTDRENLDQGVVVASVFPGNADMGVVQTNAGVTLQPFVNDFDGNALPVGGSTEAPVGAAVCRSGSTTGTFCGTILAKNQTVNYPEGAVTGLTRTDVCAEGGDSGGPWLSGDQAQGVTSGGSGDCTVGGETFFQPITEILETNNLTLLTTGGAAGGAGDDAAPPAEATTAPPAEATEPPADDDAGQQQRSGHHRRGHHRG